MKSYTVTYILPANPAKGLSHEVRNMDIDASCHDAAEGRIKQMYPGAEVSVVMEALTYCPNRAAVGE